MTRNVNLLRDFLKCVLPSLIRDDVELRVENAELLGDSTKVKVNKLDLLVTTADGDTVNIEMQLWHEAGLENRMQLYLARTHSRQLDGGESYATPHCTYSIWLCKFKLHEDNSYIHDFLLYDPERQVAFPNSIHLLQLELPKFANATGNLYNWLKFLDADTEEEVMSMATENMAMGQASAFVQYMNMTPSERAIAEAHLRDVYEKKAAYAEGEARGIIKISREFGLSDSEILQRLATNLKCSQAEAERLFRDAEANGALGNAV